MPGVSYERQLQFTPSGPVVVHIIRAPRPGGLYALRPLLSNDSLLGRETVTSMQRRAMASANVAGVNGDLFTWDEGLPSGMLMQSGVLEAPPHPKRSTLGITDDGSLIIDRVTMLGQWQGSGPRRALNGLNQRPGAQGISLFTPVWGAATPQASGTVEVVLEPFPPAAPFTDLSRDGDRDQDRRRHADPAGRRSPGRPWQRREPAGRGIRDRRADDRQARAATAVGCGGRRDRRRPVDRPRRPAGVLGARGLSHQPDQPAQSPHGGRSARRRTDRDGRGRRAAVRDTASASRPSSSRSSSSASER